MNGADTLPPAPSLAKTRLFAVVAVAIAGAAVAFLALGGLGDNLVYYWSPSELRQNADKAVGATIRLGGQVAPGTIDFNSGTSKLRFSVKDGDNSVEVRADGIPPAMFRENIGVVVEGTMTKAGRFESNRLMVSHSNEYRAPGDDPRVDVKDLMKTTSGLEPEPKKP